MPFPISNFFSGFCLNKTKVTGFPDEMSGFPLRSNRLQVPRCRFEMLIS